MNIGSVGSAATGAEIDRSITVARRLHAKVVRMEVPWSVMEPTSAAEVDPRALAYTDRVTADAAANGIKVIMMVQSTPCWASSAPPALLRRCSPSRPSAAGSWPPSKPDDFAVFGAYLAKRYGPALAAIEIWNEPDQSNEAYFAGPSKPARYAALLRAVYPAIKQADPSVEVLGGSLVGSNGLFLRALYAAGIKGYYDALSVHYYNLTVASLRSIHEVQVANGDATQLWLDEFGWTSCWPHRKIQQEQGCVPARTQARTSRTPTACSARRPTWRPRCSTSCATRAGKNSACWASTGRTSRRSRRFAHALASPTAPVSGVTLALRARRGSLLASGSAPVGDFMVLEAFQGSVLRYRALFTLDRFNRYSLALPAVLGTSGLRVRVFQYWTGPRRAAPQQQHLSSLRVAEQRDERQREDLQVQAERPVRDVVVVPLDALGERGLAAQAVHLRPARDAGLDAVAVAVADDVLAEQLDELGALGARADEAHVAAQHVEQLRQLVERGAAQEAPDGGAPVRALDAAGRDVAGEQEVERARVVLRAFCLRRGRRASSGTCRSRRPCRRARRAAG